MHVTTNRVMKDTDRGDEDSVTSSLKSRSCAKVRSTRPIRVSSHDSSYAYKTVRQESKAASHVSSKRTTHPTSNQRPMTFEVIKSNV